MEGNIKTNVKGKRKTEKKFKELRKNFPLYTMLLPGTLLIFLFHYMPMFGIILPFKKINVQKGIFASPWAGLANFKYLFTSPDTWVITRNTVGYNVAWLLIGLVISIGMAVLLSIIASKTLSKVYQTILIMPHFLSMVIVAYLVLAFLNMENGYINKHIVEGIFHKEPVNWYIKPEAWPYILTIVNFWKTAGYSSIVYLAAIAGIDTQLYEATEIDGAGKWKQMCHITLPSLKSLAIILTIFNVGKIFNSDFGLFYQVTQNSGALYPTTYVINTYVYRMMLSSGTGSLGMASAAALYQSIVGFILVLITNGIVRKVDDESSLF